MNNRVIDYDFIIGTSTNPIVLGKLEMYCTKSRFSFVFYKIEL